MELSIAIEKVASFKGTNLKLNLNLAKQQLLGKGKAGIIQLPDLFEAALELKRQSAQIDEIVHASGIVRCLPAILEEHEIIEDLSLAAGAEGEGFDLITNRRIAEFKFARWQDEAGNGTRKRQVFADFVNLLLYPSPKKKQLYVYDAEKIKKYLQSKRASWQKVLSKSGGLDKTLEAHLTKNIISAKCLNDIYRLANIDIIDLDTVLV